MVLMTPEAFKETMLALQKKHLDMEQETGDVASFHMEADTLMEDLLEELGYGDGVQIFRDSPKWYT